MHSENIENAQVDLDMGSEGEKGVAQVDMDMGSEGDKGAAQDEGDALVDRFVKKGFGAYGEFIGNVVSYDSSSGFYHVLYEDKDKEDFELTELIEILIAEVEVTDEMHEKFRKLKRKSIGQTPPKRSRREKSSANEVATPEPRTRARREKSKVNEDVSTGSAKRARRKKSNINEVANSEPPKRARREKSKVNEVVSFAMPDSAREEKTKLNLEEVDGGDGMKPEPKVTSEIVGDGMKLDSKEGEDNVDGKIRVGENSGVAEVKTDTKVSHSVDSKSENEPKEGADYVDGKIRVAENSEDAEVETDAKVLHSVHAKSKSEPKEGRDNVDGKIRVAENSEDAEVETDTKVPHNVDTKCKNQPCEGGDNVDGKIRVAENSKDAEVETDTKVSHSVDSECKNEPNEGGDNVDGKIRVPENSEDVASNYKNDPNEGADNVDGKIRVAGNSKDVEVETDTKVPDSVAVDSKSNTEPKECADNVDGNIRVGEIVGDAEVENGTKVLTSGVSVDSKSTIDRRGTKRKGNVETATSMAFESIMTVSSQEESTESQGQKRRKVSQNGVNANEFTASENLETVTPRGRRGRPKIDGVTQNSQKCSAQQELSSTAQMTTQRRGRGRPKNDGVTQNSQKCSAQKELSSTGQMRTPWRGRGRPKNDGVTQNSQECSVRKESSSTAQTRTQQRRRGRPKKDEAIQNSQKCSAQKEFSSTSQRRRKRTWKKIANGPGWSDPDDGKNSSNLEVGSYTVGNEELSSDVDASDCNDSGQVVLSGAIEDPLPPIQPLPESSGDIILPDSAVPDLLSVYTFLRVSSDLLFLSPFTLEDFLGALHFKTMNSLLDSVHVSLLRALRQHLEKLLTEGNNKASTCLRQLDWDFLDAVTWPFYLAVYLLTQHGSEKLRLKMVNLNILNGEYYRIMASTKLTILQLLCDDVMETEEFRTKLNTLIGFEHDIDDDEKINMLSTPNESNRSDPSHHKSKQILSSIGDIQKSSHDSINSISDNSILQNEQGKSSNGEVEFTAVAMNDGEDFNSDECRLCGMDGGLLCCDSCPSSYHSRCVGMSKAHIPQGPWYCLECEVKKSDAVALRTLETLSGAEIFGIDPYGRVFFGTCGYLLVADFASKPTVEYRYYSKCDAKKIVEFLGICGPFYSEIRSAILHYWGISDSKNDTTCLQNSETISGNSPTQPSYVSLAEHLVMQDEASRSGLPSGSVEGKTEKANCAHVPECLVNRNNAKLTQETEIALEADGQLFVTGISDCKENLITSTKGSPVVDPNTLMDMNVHKIDLDRTSRLSGQVQPKSLSISMQEQVGLNANDGKGFHADVCDSNFPYKIKQLNAVGKTTDGEDSKTSFWGSRSSFQPYAYRNHYASGDIAASAAAMLTSMTFENNTLGNARGVSKKTLAATIQEQIKAISKVSGQFYWPSFNKKAMEPPRERCGWCSSCTSTATCRRACVLNAAASSVMGGVANIFGGIRLKKNGEGHLPAVAAYILYIEDCLRGLVVGPWENLSYRTHWRKCVEQASTVKEIRASLLELERNIRLIALETGWTKHVEDPTSLVLTIHPATSVTTPAPRRGRRSHKSSVSSVTVPAPNYFRQTTFHWRRRGRLHSQVFQHGILPCATVKRTGRQGGLRRIHGVLYAEGSDIPIKSRQYIWRTAVELATSLSQLAVQIRYLDAHVKWKDLELPENRSQYVRAAGKVAAPFPDATVCDKKHEGGDVQYLLDFGNQIDIPISVVKYGTRVEETQESNNRYWLGEIHVPLYLLKAFEEGLLQACQTNVHKQVSKNQNRLVQRSRKKDGFSVLFSEPEMKENSSCMHCSGDVSIKKSVKCTSCAGSFHPQCTVKSETVDKSECHFTCYECHNIRLLDRRDNRNHKIINVESKKNVANKLVEIEGSCLQPFGARGVLQDHLGIALNPPRRRRSNSSGKNNGPIWKKNDNSELGRDFRENYLLLACETDVVASDGPMCFLCSQAYNPRLLYVGCTSCRAWFHGEAFRINQENIADLGGFKCYKCRKKSRPECPYETTDSKVRREKLPVRRQSKDNRGQNHGLYGTDGKPKEMMQRNSGEALNGLWTTLYDEEKHFATTSEPDMKNALYANLSKVNQEMHRAVKSEPDANNALHSDMMKDYQTMHTGVKSETDFYHSSEVPPSYLNQSSESKIFRHLELSTVGTEASSSQLEWNFPVMDWPQEDHVIEATDGNWNPVEAYHQNEPLFTFTELLAGDHDQVEDLVNVSNSVVDNWTDGLRIGKEISMDSQTNGVESRECLSGYVMSSKTLDSQQDDEHNTLIDFQWYGTASSVVLDKTQVPSMDNTVRSGEMLSDCKVCGIADLLPYYQCNLCRVAIHHHCYQVQQIGFWSTSGWICNSCRGGLLKGL